jgi:hypothetical protein
MHGIWKFGGMRRGFEKGRCPICREVEAVIRTILKCSEMKKWNGTVSE